MNEQLKRYALQRLGIVAFLGVSAITVIKLQAKTTSPAPMQWTTVSVDLPSSDVVFPDGDGAQIANSYCLMCHSSGMVLRQPPLTQSQWQAEIQKMRAFWGSLLPVDQEVVLVRYLAQINGPATGE